MGVGQQSESRSASPVPVAVLARVALPPMRRSPAQVQCSRCRSTPLPGRAALRRTQLAAGFNVHPQWAILQPRVERPSSFGSYCPPFPGNFLKRSSMMPRSIPWCLLSPEVILGEGRGLSVGWIPRELSGIAEEGGRGGFADEAEAKRRSLRGGMRRGGDGKRYIKARDVVEMGES